MKCNATIIVEGNVGKLEDCLKPDMVDYDRSSCAVKKSGDKIQFDITAKDAVALRATLNAISQSLAIYERIADKKL